MKLQDFLATAIPQAAADLESALLRLPDDKRNWSAGGDARTALDMVAEVAILNGTTADILATKRGLKAEDMTDFDEQKAALYDDWDALQKLLHDNTARAAKAVAALPDDDLNAEVEMPWGQMTLSQLADYPYWNAKYHEGQINFIASLLGCLK